jgi:hypothetical protein
MAEKAATGLTEQLVMRDLNQQAETGTTKN